jgi:hypothetical protein
MGSATSKKSLLSTKVVILLVSLILTGIIMHVLSPAQKLDSRFFYTYEQATSYLENLSELEKKNYFSAELFDLWFMLNYTWLLFLGWQKNVSSKKMLWIAFIPGLLDLFETSLILNYLHNREFSSAYQFLPVISSLKWFLGISILLYLGKKFLSRRAKS